MSTQKPTMSGGSRCSKETIVKDFIDALPEEGRSALRVTSAYTTHAIGRAAGFYALGAKPSPQDLLGPVLGTALAMVQLIDMSRAALGAPPSEDYAVDFGNIADTLGKLMVSATPAERDAALRHYRTGQVPPTLSEVLHIVGEVARAVPNTEEQ